MKKRRKNKEIDINDIKPIKIKDSKIRNIAFSIILFLFIIGYVIYGVYTFYSSPKKVYNRVLNEADRYLTKSFNDFNINNLNYTYNHNNIDHKIGIYTNKNDIVLYNDTYYYDLSDYLKTKGIIINTKELNKKENKKIIKDSFIAVLKLYEEKFEYLKIKNKNSGDYIYSYTMSDMTPIILTLETNKEFMKVIDKIFITDEKVNILDYLKNRSFEIRVNTENLSKDINFFSIRIDGLLNIKFRDNYLSGYIMEYGFSNDNNFILMKDDWQITLIKTKYELNKKSLKKAKDIDFKNFIFNVYKNTSK